MKGVSVSRLLSLAAICAVVALCAGAGAARPERPPQAVLMQATGDLRLSNSADGQAIFQASGLAPGRSVTGTVRLTNSGTLPGDLSLQQLDVSDSARLFAMLDLTAADALISTWNDKYRFNFWRPITAIRKAGADGNPATTADPGWTPMFDPSLPAAIGGAGPALITPPYPDHSSGANAYASSSMSAFAAFFGTDEMTFYATSSRFPAEQRVFNRFSDLINEVIEARIWAGIHFRSADEQAAQVGRDVARYVHVHQFAAAH